MNIDQIRKQLHPDLVPYLEAHPRYGTMLRHPLFRGIGLGEKITTGPTPEFPFRNVVEMTNAGYLHKREALAEAWRVEDWHSIVFLHERYARLEALMEVIAWNEGPHHLWPIIGHVWRDSENIRHYADEWRELWSTECKRRPSVMSKYERARFRKLPDELTVWRGVSHEDAVAGFSWTLDRKKAAWFAERLAFGDAPRLLARGTITKDKACALFTGRRESEIVVLPEHVAMLEVERLETE